MTNGMSGAEMSAQNALSHAPAYSGAGVMGVQTLPPPQAGAAGAPYAFAGGQVRVYRISTPQHS